MPFGRSAIIFATGCQVFAIIIKRCKRYSSVFNGIHNAIAFIRAFFYQHIFFCSETIPPCFIFVCQIASVNSTFTQCGDWNSRGRRSEKVITSRIPFCLSSVGTIASPSGERRIGYQLFVNFWRDLRPPTLAFRYWEIRKLTGRVVTRAACTVAVVDKRW